MIQDRQLVGANRSLPRSRSHGAGFHLDSKAYTNSDLQRKHHFGAPSVSSQPHASWRAPLPHHGRHMSHQGYSQNSLKFDRTMPAATSQYRQYDPRQGNAYLMSPGTTCNQNRRLPCPREPWSHNQLKRTTSYSSFDVESFSSSMSPPSQRRGLQLANAGVQKPRRKKYVCQYCNKVLTQKCNLESHLRVHTGERPYKCDVCPMAFKQMTNLRRHRGRIHNLHGKVPRSCKATKAPLPPSSQSPPAAPEYKAPKLLQLEVTPPRRQYRRLPGRLPGAPAGKLSLLWPGAGKDFQITPMDAMSMSSGSSVCSPGPGSMASLSTPGSSSSFSTSHSASSSFSRFSFQ